jgi:hypothetical protein
MRLASPRRGRRRGFSSSRRAGSSRFERSCPRTSRFSLASISGRSPRATARPYWIAATPRTSSSTTSAQAPSEPRAAPAYASSAASPCLPLGSSPPALHSHRNEKAHSTDDFELWRSRQLLVRFNRVKPPGLSPASGPSRVWLALPKRLRAAAGRRSSSRSSSRATVTRAVRPSEQLYLTRVREARLARRNAGRAASTIRDAVGVRE